ncbi:MAG: chromosome segregation protein SMC [Chroococcales cyanobacterium]
MVHVKRVELSHFKSFGGTTGVPFLPGFTVISGPNGSGKSNILDALLFCLGLSSSKGMRAERLPDLINHKQSNQRGASETMVTVTFDLSDWEEIPLIPSEKSDNNGNGKGNLEENAIAYASPSPTEDENHSIDNSQSNSSLDLSKEWTVTRRLRVTKGGSYSSTYYMNGEVCTATELHEQLRRLRIYPEGYNVVLQGDVTSIISMNARERREIIDELAGVAEFDRKINQVRTTLQEVREKEERCQIIQQELVKSCDRLAADRIKAEKYQKLKAQIQEKQQWEAVLIWRSLLQQESELQQQISQGETELEGLTQQLNTLSNSLRIASETLETLNNRVKALGEDEQLSVASQLATQKVQRQQLQQKSTELENQQVELKSAIAQITQEITQQQQQLEDLSQQRIHLETNVITTLIEEWDAARIALAESREQSTAIASASEAWVQEQTALTHKITELQKRLNPQRTEQAQLSERQTQLQQKITEQTQFLDETEQEIQTKTTNAASLDGQVSELEAEIQSLTEQLTTAQEELKLQQETQTRLLREQREKQRQLDKLEATNQAQQEAQGTYATKILIQSGLDGICGLVAQLGQVEPRYQLALETAAGARLGYLVVEDDEVAALGIELLKRERAGRATFLPLNKIRSPRFTTNTALTYAQGFIDYAVNLIDCDSRYKDIFGYVFGSTVVFETLTDARSHLGQYRMVTLQGEILESSGAMTGGSISKRSSLQFGTATAGESQEIQELRSRLDEISRILHSCDQFIAQKSQIVNTLSKEITEKRQEWREKQLRWEQFLGDINRLKSELEKVRSQHSQNTQELETVSQRLQELSAIIPTQESELAEYQQQLSELEESHSQSEWQAIQTQIKQQESDLQIKEQALREAQENLSRLSNQRSRLEDKIQQLQQRLEDSQKQQEDGKKQQETVAQSLGEIQTKIAETEGVLEQLSHRLTEAKQERDRAEKELRSLQNKQQQSTWQHQKIREQQQQRQETLTTLKQQIQQQETELPNPLPEVPTLVASDNDNIENITFDTYSEQLEHLQKELRNAQKRLEAMEPVNMLALEEYEKTQTRLQELSEKLATLEGERTELLLRIENFTTLRYRAFKEAFDAVNENFQTIFATLSEGDGYLELEDPEEPFSGGLNLIAHPKGKPVQRLSSMSGGEKSLTALSFIFALQRYRPSPFYAFDEVDMFLDGANVERLAKMIRQQSEQAQFIVVSLRRPMIESADRQIGVTQARGAYTQVLGITL